MSHSAKLKFVSDEIIDNKKIRKTEEITVLKGSFNLGETHFKLTKIGETHITIEIDELKSPKARFIVQKQILGKTITVPLKSCNIAMGNWFDFSDGTTNIKHAIYLAGINYVRG